MRYGTNSMVIVTKNLNTTKTSIIHLVTLCQQIIKQGRNSENNSEEFPSKHTPYIIVKISRRYIMYQMNTRHSVSQKNKVKS